LEEIGCFGNLLTNIILPTNHINLKKLDLCSNNFPTQDLSFLTPYANLEDVDLRNGDEEKINQGIYNRFTGSLDYLSEMKQLKKLGISDTDLNKVDLDKLPRSLELLRYSINERSDCKLVDIFPQLEE